MNSLVQYIINNVDPKEYYRSIFPDAVWGSSNEARVFSPFVKEKVPSFSINGETGAWYSFCHSDQRGGKSIVSFHTELRQVTTNEAARQIFHQFVHPTIDDKLVRRYCRKLKNTPSVLAYLKSRLISRTIAVRYKLGWNGVRIAFPIYNEFGLCVNIKFYDPLTKSGSKIPKMIHYTIDSETRSHGSPPMLYPLSTFAEEPKTIVICEGEWDTLNLLSLGIPAVTTTSGARSWPSNFNEYFRNREVLIAYDNDDSGKEGQALVLKQLINIAKSIKAMAPRIILNTPIDIFIILANTQKLCRE